MKAFTVREPYAGLIKQGVKTYEFRNLKTNYRGPVLIHASANIFKEAMHELKDLLKEDERSVIVAEAYLQDCVELSDELITKLIKLDKRVYQKTACIYKYAWVLKQIKPIHSNFKIKGQLGLWNLDDELYKKIKEESYES